jgi:NTE family protein
LDYETLDSRYFSHRGTALSLNFELLTDNFYQWRDHGPLYSLSLSWTTAIPLSERLSLVPSLYGRMITTSADGDPTQIPFTMINMVGGRFFGRYMPQQLPFDGIGYMETTQNIFAAAKLQGRFRIGRRHYVSGSFNYGLSGDKFFDLSTPLGREYFGAALDYGYDLRGFPLQATLSWSNITRSVGFYFQAGYTF